MKRTQFFLKAFLSLSLLPWTAAYAQITPLSDSYIDTATPTTNYGSKTLLDVDGATQTLTFNSIWPRFPLRPASARPR